MNTRCDICGCETDPSDIQEYLLSDKPKNVCSFCRKRIKEVEANPVNKSEAARNLLFMDTKGHRSEDTNILIRKHFYELGIDITSVPHPYNQENIVPVTAQVQAAPAQVNVDMQTAELKKELEDLKKSFYRFRRRYYISKILSFVIPIVVLIIGLIILYKMGTIQTFVDYFNMLEEYASA